MIVIPVRNAVLFPGAIMPLGIGRASSIAAAREAVAHERPIAVLLQRDPAQDNPGPDDLHWVGTEAQVMRFIGGQNGHHMICQGERRVRVLQFLEGWPYLVARVSRVEETAQTGNEIDARVMSLRERVSEILQLMPQVPAEFAAGLQNVESGRRLADLVAGLLDVTIAQKQELLETFDLRERLDRVLVHLGQRLDVLRLSRQIDDQTRSSLEDQQRRHLLREQMKTIRKELGEEGERDEELEDLERRIAEAKMPAEVEKQARKELARLQRMPDGAGEASMVRTYLECLVELPWAPEDPPAIDIARAREVLDADHFGLQKIKRRILEYLAVRKLNPNGRSPILCFVGPPGVGKTSLGQSIARATGRRFERLSLGGVHDEAEIRGHRRTYIGSMPGNVIQGVRKAGTRNAVFMLDEIDKLGAGGFHGDPSSALLEVLDPEQNSTFRDNYLGVPFDLSRIMFIATANVLETIPGPLRDRMEIVQLAGYTEQEKIEIARRYLLRRQLEVNGLDADRCSVDDGTLRALVHDYTREAGVRNLERELGAVLRHAAVRIAEGEAGPIELRAGSLPGILGPAKFESEIAMHAGVPGVATGLAWTPVGGDILFIESTRVPGGARLILTGQLGEVMKESAQAAVSLVKARAAALGVDPESFEKSDLHLHVPAGATPKDGPSAGVALFVSLVSLLTGRAVRPDTAMTGEISLRGLVLPVGGIKEKVLAAQRAGITRVLLPARNRKDMEDIPAEIRDALEFHFIERVDDALQLALAAVVEPAAA
ncbi:MAG: endopeptidase La [Gammaproteobacteria bacterium]